MTTAEILAAAAERLEQNAWDPESTDFSISAVIEHVASSAPAAVTAIRYFAGFVRSDGIAWERESGRTKAEVVRALRDAASAAS